MCLFINLIKKEEDGKNPLLGGRGGGSWCFSGREDRGERGLLLFGGVFGGGFEFLLPVVYQLHVALRVRVHLLLVEEQPKG